MRLAVWPAESRPRKLTGKRDIGLPRDFRGIAGDLT